MPDDVEDDDQDEPSDNSVIRDLRKQLKDSQEAQARVQELEAENAKIRRQSAFKDAGLDPANKLHALAMQGYDGDFEADKVQAYVAELGLAPSAPANVAPPAAELEQFGQVGQQMASGDVPPPAPSEQDEYEKMFAAIPDGTDPLSKLQKFADELQRRGGPTTNDGPAGNWENQILR